ncbi:hypothetical protein [Agriterribacter sp.]|uniref:hypothetical protein n=1 Tax=Agriterribacter sp. TaxID=2821509 RepID=UPI002C8BB759|nr:hypothetical protein [Agriterribacter sp.]HRO48502.1 hypothetical protein [Agriterribacter sp.]HRQ17249.1 hypothetical protein [Agriterribacter sp.]
MNKEIRHPLVATTYDGKKAVIISSGHPHKDEVAICIGAEYTSMGWAIKWKTVESDEAFLTTRGTEIKWL